MSNDLLHTVNEQATLIEMLQSRNTDLAFKLGEAEGKRSALMCWIEAGTQTECQCGFCKTARIILAGPSHDAKP